MHNDEKMYAIMNWGNLNILDSTNIEANYGVYSGSGGNLNVKGQVKTVAKNMAYNLNGSNSKGGSGGNMTWVFTALGAVGAIGGIFLIIKLRKRVRAA